MTATYLNNQSSYRTAKFGSGSTIISARKSEPLSLDTIQRSCPSVFADDKHESRSQKYTFISTYALLEGMIREGFGVFEVRQGGSRDTEKRGFTKHMLRFRHASALAPVGGTVQEVIMLNAHDGTSSYQLFSGGFRFVCCNGIISMDTTQENSAIRIPHKGNVLDQVVDASFQVIDSGSEQQRKIQHMQSVPLSMPQEMAFAEAAASLRWNGDESVPVQPRQLLSARRHDDLGVDVWSTFNRVQENLVKGGLHFVRNQTMRNGQGDVVGQRRVDATTRPVMSIDGDVKLNRALWILAERMAQLAG